MIFERSLTSNIDDRGLWTLENNLQQNKSWWTCVRAVEAFMASDIMVCRTPWSIIALEPLPVSSWRRTPLYLAMMSLASTSVYLNTSEMAKAL